MSGLLLALALAADGLAPLAPGSAAAGSRVDVVLRAAPIAGEPAELRVLASDAVTDAPVEGAKPEVRLFGPLGTAEVGVPARPGSLPGHYLAQATLPAAGSYAFVASVGGELVTGDGVRVAAKEEGRRAFPWGALFLAVGLGCLAVPGGSGRGLLALLLCLGAADARAHGVYAPPPAAVPGAEVYVAQEIQFALGLRTALPTIEAFEAPDGAGAPRRFIAVPRSAVVDREGHKLIFVREAPERFVAREPKLGWEGHGGVAVLTGVNPDEKVVVAGAAFLRNGGAAEP